MNKDNVYTALKFGGIVLVFLLVSVAASLVIWLNMAKNATYTPDPSNPLGEDGYVEETLIDIPRHTNVFIAGVDAETQSLTDFMMVGSYDKDTGEIDFINIPRDTACALNAEQMAEVNAAGIHVPSTIKLNELHSYTRKLGMEFLTSYMEDFLGVEIQYYALVDLNVLHDLVTAMDGVYFDVPQRMYYNDNAQDLHIDLEPGYQLLDADQAEQLLRYRKGYANADLGRIEVQQDFLAAMMEQLLSLDTFLSNPIDFISTVFKNVETNATPVDIAKYVQEIPKISPNNIEFHTPEIDRTNRYVYLDELELQKLVDEIFYDIEPVVEEPVGETTATEGTESTGTTTTNP